MGRKVGEVLNGQFEEGFFHRFSVLQGPDSEAIRLVFVPAGEKIHQGSEIERGRA